MPGKSLLKVFYRLNEPKTAFHPFPCRGKVRPARRNPLRAKNGFSFIELLVSVGIITVLAGVAYPFYMNYLNSSRISQISMTANNYFKTMVACLSLYEDDFSRCDTKAEINFDCDDCTELAKHTPPAVRYSVTLTKDKLSACFIHRDDCSTGIRKRVTLNKKLCSKVPVAGRDTCNYGTSTPSTKVPALPLKVCSQASDCATGQVCEAYQGIRASTNGCM